MRDVIFGLSIYLGWWLALATIAYVLHHVRPAYDALGGSK